MSALAMELPRIYARIPAEQLAAATRKCKRSAVNWIEGKSQPSASDLVAIMREFDCVTREVLSLAGKCSVTDAQVEAAKQALKILEGS